MNSIDGAAGSGARLRPGQVVADKTVHIAGGFVGDATYREPIAIGSLTHGSAVRQSRRDPRHVYAVVSVGGVRESVQLSGFRQADIAITRLGQRVPSSLTLHDRPGDGVRLLEVYLGGHALHVFDRGRRG